MLHGVSDDGQPADSSPPLAVTVYGLAVFLGAFLLFQIQPLISKFFLPWFGGSNAVWITAMLVFQALLLAGYAYSHIIATRLPAKRQSTLHLLVMATPMLLLALQFILWKCPLLPPAMWKPESWHLPVARLSLLLLSSVALPFFLLATTSSLLQAWFSVVCPARSPYPLYALSNLGSLLGLVTYPFILEPLVGLRHQAMMWAAGFGLFCGCCVIAARLHRRALPGDPKRVTLPPDTAPANALQEPLRIDRHLWLLLSATGSLAFLATTNYITQEVGALSLLWILPLGLYLASFVIAFRGSGYRRGPWAVAGFVSLALLVFSSLRRQGDLSLEAQLGYPLAAQFFACVLCHGELHRLRPSPTLLTAFYLSTAAGGVMGGLIVALAAPMLFPSILEFPFSFAFAAILVLLANWRDPNSPLHGRFRIPARIIAALALVTSFVFVLPIAKSSSGHTVFRKRNFFGVISVISSLAPGNGHRLNSLFHGTTCHGMQAVGFDRMPTTYYGWPSGISLAITSHPHYESGLRVGSVGLGVGTTAAYGRRGDTYRFYEIDADIIALAANRQDLFTFIPKSEANIEIIPGDARISLENEFRNGQKQNFDLLILDAFSGDATPVHLMTLEAFRLYLAHLRSDGVIAVHISNRFFEWEPLLREQASALGLSMAVYTYPANYDRMTFPSKWVLLSPSKDTMEHYRTAERPADTRFARTPRPWTDDYSNPLSLLKIGPNSLKNLSGTRGASPADVKARP